jgi:chaperonin cofactor prefoldin
MLTQEDLKNIGIELSKVIEQNVAPALEQMATKEEVKELGDRVGRIENQVGNLENQVNHIENQMVTKDYLDEKLADFRGDLNVMMRKGDAKLLRLIQFLKEKAILNDSQVQELFSMEPFPKLV